MDHADSLTDRLHLNEKQLLFRVILSKFLFSFDSHSHTFWQFEGYQVVVSDKIGTDKQRGQNSQKIEVG